MARSPIAQSKTSECSGLRLGAFSTLPCAAICSTMASICSGWYPRFFSARGTVVLTMRIDAPPTSFLFLTRARSGSMPVVSQSIIRPIVPVGASTLAWALRQPLRSPSARHCAHAVAAATDAVRSAGADDKRVLEAAATAWAQCLALGERNGWRNAQPSGLAPTGSLGRMMDCDTTCIEPDLALVKNKKLVGGASMRIVNTTVPRALKNLGYQPEQIEAIVEHIAAHGNVLNAPSLKPEHYDVFDCAMGERAISAMGHVRMMAAVQPALSGAISKTVNVPESATVDDIEQVYVQGWKLGLKALAIYRDNCKVGQPLSAAGAVTEPRPTRKRLPKVRPSTTVSFTVGGAEGYLIAGSYPDDGLGEVFIKMSKQGSTLAGVMDAFSIAISIGLQYGVPLEAFVSKFTNMRFDPAGMTDDPDVRMAQSVMDYIFRRLALDNLPYDERAAPQPVPAPRSG